jgi:hypothetical protein
MGCFGHLERGRKQIQQEVCSEAEGFSRKNCYINRGKSYEIRTLAAVRML